MNLAELCMKQIAEDERRGFAVRFSTETEMHTQLMKDLIGLFSEASEFADVVKKIGLRLDQPKYEGPTLDESRHKLGKELSDILIYVIRLAAILDIDLESVLLETMRTNRDRYAYLVE